ncbi:hypothetical protein [Streptomyces gilvosporeus]|uniref:Uncharacterized protein n=1 Tax=Streptomyces gilvosporeus TaxID=553510 RepID=A0A1V0TL26_9ACTN|nr:hypothetical protein [Streptomyces gilvosporeus]ARF53498.1 hypothetical protein B1H19_04330 [Streptomyces gilvosporeus]
MRGRSSLLKVVRDHLPFAHGGVVEVARHAPTGEARRDRHPADPPARAVQPARESPLVDMLARQGTTLNATMHINQRSAASNPRALTDRFADGIVRRLGTVN